MLAFLILGLGRRLVNKEVEDISSRAYRILLHGIFTTIVVFFLWEIGSYGSIASRDSHGGLGCFCIASLSGSPCSKLRLVSAGSPGIEAGGSRKAGRFGF